MVFIAMDIWLAGRQEKLARMAHGRPGALARADIYDRRVASTHAGIAHMALSHRVTRCMVTPRNNGYQCDLHNDYNYGENTKSVFVAKLKVDNKSCVLSCMLTSYPVIHTQNSPHTYVTASQ